MSRMINFPHIAAMVFGAPLYATSELVTAVKAVLEPRLLGRTTTDVEFAEDIAGVAMGRDDLHCHSHGLIFGHHTTPGIDAEPCTY